MNTRPSLTLVLGLALAVTPVSVAAQADGPAASEAINRALVNQLCSATATNETELDACVSAVEAALVRMTEELPKEEQGLVDQISDTVDDTLEDLREVDVRAAFDDLAENAQDLEIDVDLEGVQQAVDDAIAEAQTTIDELGLPTDIDIQGALDEAVTEALAATDEIDLQEAVDEALAEAKVVIEEADLQGTVDEAVAALEDSVADARAIVGEAESWVQENSDAVCRGSSISLGTTAGIAVFVVTGVEWLGLRAFQAVEAFTNAACGDVVGEPE
jgi:flavin-binding protein dodecin